MKTSILKWAIRIVLVTWCIIGIPTAHKLMSLTQQKLAEDPMPMTLFESLVAIPGIIAIVAGIAGLFILLMMLFVHFAQWIVKN
jgi:hypothetical protein